MKRYCDIYRHPEKVITVIVILIYYGEIVLYRTKTIFLLHLITPARSAYFDSVTAMISTKGEQSWPFHNHHFAISSLVKAQSSFSAKNMQLMCFLSRHYRSGETFIYLIISAEKK